MQPYERLAGGEASILTTDHIKLLRGGGEAAAVSDDKTRLRPLGSTPHSIFFKKLSFFIRNFFNGL
ncbi:MAG: hypothetical protein AAGK38_10355 [Pseudomonadota bacterium]